MDQQTGKKLSVIDTLGPVSLSGGLGAYLLVLCSEGIAAVPLSLWATLKFWFYSGLRRTEELRPGAGELAILRGRGGSFFAIDLMESICVEYSLFEADFIRIERTEQQKPVSFRLGDKNQTERARFLLGSAYQEQYEERGFD